MREGEGVVKGGPGGLAPWNDNKPLIQQTIHSTEYLDDVKCNIWSRQITNYSEGGSLRITNYSEGQSRQITNYSEGWSLRIALSKKESSKNLLDI